MAPSIDNNALCCDGKFLITSKEDMVVGDLGQVINYVVVEGISGSSIVCDTTHRKLWDSGYPIHRGISKWRDMSEMVEVDTTDGSVISVVEPYWLRRV